MRNRSVKRAKQEREYSAIRVQFLYDYPVCQVPGCYMTSHQVHHKKGRIGDLLTDVRYFLAVCWGCHKQIEENPKWAKENGYSLSRLSKEVSELKKV